VILQGLLQHGGHPNMNLYEGNYCPAIGLDNTWGSSAYNSALRNRAIGYNPSAGTSLGLQYAFAANITNRHSACIGNVLGTTGVNVNYEDYGGESGGCKGNAIYYFGYFDVGCQEPHDTLARSTCIRAYNWTSATLTNNGIVPDGFVASDIPSSYYLSGKPSWFGSLTWPPVDPASPAYSSSFTNIPAGYRLVYGTDPPAGTINQPPIATASAAPTNGPAPLAVSFSSAGSFDPEGAALTYIWAFGDGGTSTAANPSHTYQNAGTYSGQLSVSDGTNTTSSALITIRATIPGTNQPPVAVANATPTSGVAPLAVAFSSTGSFDPEGATLTYNWTFGDGTTSTAANPSHSYAAGTFNATLKVSDGTNNTSSSLLTITVTNPPPTVLLTSPTNGASYAAPATINLAASVTPNGHTITQVQFYNGTTLLGADTSAPYTLSWTNVGAGGYSLLARAVYDAGATTDSSVVSIGVGGLVAAYGFEEGSGTTVDDSSGNGNNGTVSGATWTTNGRFGSALSFGAGALVTVSNSPSIDLTTGMTLEAWVYPTSLNGSWMNVIFKSNGNPGSQNPSYVLQGSTPTGLTPSLFISSAPSNLATPSALPVNAWSHLAATYDGTTMTLYVNGAPLASQSASGAMTVSTDALTIGGNAFSGQNWVGLIDEIRIYNRALTQSEIQADMARSVVEIRPLPPTGLRVVGP